MIVSTEGTSVHVAKGQVIGKVGMTGNTTGPHIHLSVLKGNEYPWGLVDPLGWEGENPDPWEQYSVGDKHGSKSVNLFLARAPVKTGVDFAGVKVEVPAGDPATFSFLPGPFEKAAENVASVVNSFFLEALTSFTTPLNLIVSYAGVDLKNFVEDTVQLYFFDEVSSQWTAMPSVVDQTNKTVTAVTSHLSHFALMGQVRDLVAPTTTANLIGTKGQDGWYRSKVNVELVGRDNAGGLGVHYVLYSLNENDWFKYSLPVAFSGDGKYTVFYKSVDEADNREDERKAEFSIDTATPEAKIYFDAGKNKIVIEGTDANLAGVAEENGVYTISDWAGNVLQLKTQLINGSSQSYIKFLDFPKTQYYIARGMGSTTQFFQLGGSKIVTVFYDAKKNQSLVSINTAGKLTKETKAGFVLLQVFTEKGSLKWRFL